MKREGLCFAPMWRLFQALIVFAVMASNIKYQWTPNGYLAGLIAAGAAFLATVIVAKVIDLIRFRAGAAVPGSPARRVARR
jgi:hypothetical protein